MTDYFLFDPMLTNRVQVLNSVASECTKANRQTRLHVPCASTIYSDMLFEQKPISGLVIT